MKYTLAYAISALAAVAAAQKPSFLNSAFDIKAGQPFTLMYNNCEGGCTILLENGPSNGLQPVKTLSSTFSFSLFPVSQTAPYPLRGGELPPPPPPPPPPFALMMGLRLAFALPCLADALPQPMLPVAPSALPSTARSPRTRTP